MCTSHTILLNGRKAVLKEMSAVCPKLFDIYQACTGQDPTLLLHVELFFIGNVFGEGATFLPDSSSPTSMNFEHHKAAVE